MPVQPQASAVEPICEAVDGAVWAHYDRQHRLLFVGHVSERGWAVSSVDIVTGEPHDQPWPVGTEAVALLGLREAFAAAIAERVARGF